MASSKEYLQYIMNKPYPIKKYSPNHPGSIFN